MIGIDGILLQDAGNEKKTLAREGIPEEQSPGPGGPNTTLQKQVKIISSDAVLRLSQVSGASIGFT